MRKFFLGLLVILAAIFGVTFIISNDVSGSFIVLGKTLLIAVQAFMLFTAIYNGVLGYVGLRKWKKTEMVKPKNRFAVLVAAHNEEAVVGGIVRNLKKQNYPKELYDVYVICDNCTDKTAEVVRRNGGNAMERFDNELRGKGFGLEWMFEKLWDMEKYGKTYDAVVVFDADNMASRDFLNVMNTKLEAGYEVVQGYLDSKNPADTWVTKSYAFVYWSTNRMYQLGRDNLRLSAQLGGTGLLVTTKVLKEIGWRATSLTEDLEFTQRYILETGKRVAWAHDAVTFDEKPLGLVASMRQRVRWMAGHFDCAIRYAWPLIKQAVRTRSLVPFDSAMYLLGPLNYVLVGFFMLMTAFSMLTAGSVESLKDAIIASFASIHPAIYVIFIASNLLLPIIAIFLEKKISKIHWLVVSFIFGLTWIPVTIVGLFKRKNTVWAHTKHTRNVDESELDNELECV
jgi:cellulose synthase/poly-beta-1,6-N-acetylglucosamine synthase-like glycosyltransferase